MSKPESHIESSAHSFPSKELLRRYLRGELSPEERAELEQHLTDEEGMLKDALEGLQLIEDEAQFDQALGRIQQATRLRLSERHARRRQRSKRRNRVQPQVRDILPYLISAAAAVALLIVSVFVFQEYGSGPATESAAPPLAQQQPPAPEAAPKSSPEAEAPPAPVESAPGSTANEPSETKALASSQGRSTQPEAAAAEAARDQERANEERARARATRQKQQEELARLQQAESKKAEATAPATSPQPAEGKATYEAYEEAEPVAAAPEPIVAEAPTNSPSPAAALKPSDSLGQSEEALDEVVVTARRPAREQALNSAVLEEVQVAGKNAGSDPYLDSLKAATRTDDKAVEAEARWKLAQYYLQRGDDGKAKRQLKKLAKEENTYQQRAAQLLEEL